MTPGILAYASRTVLPGPSLRLRRWLFCLFLPSAVLPFLPYYFGYSPLRAAEECIHGHRFFGSWFFPFALGLGFFIAFPRLLWEARELFLGGATRPERWVALVLGIAGGIMVAGVLAYVWNAILQEAGPWDRSTATELCILSAPTLTLLAGVPVLWRLRKVFPRLVVTGCLLWPYVANLVFCAALFNPWLNGHDVDMGYYLSLPVLGAGLAECALLMLLAMRRGPTP